MEIRPWQRGDEVLAVAAERFISATSLANRFLAGVGDHLPSWYLRHIWPGPRDVWEAQVAVGEHYLLGWAELGRSPGRPGVVDLAVIVADPWQRQGIASALIRKLIPMALAAGDAGLSADALPGNRAVHGLLASVFGSDLSWRYEDGVVHYELPLREPALTSW
jgi:GNAT superfamily N-acetyltransferase